MSKEGNSGSLAQHMLQVYDETQQPIQRKTRGKNAIMVAKGLRE